VLWGGALLGVPLRCRVVHIVHWVGQQSRVLKFFVVHDVNIGTSVVAAIGALADIEGFLHHITQVPPFMPVVEACNLTASLFTGCFGIGITGWCSTLCQAQTSVCDLTSSAFDRLIGLENVIVSLLSLIIGKAGGLVGAQVMAWEAVAGVAVDGGWVHFVSVVTDVTLALGIRVVASIASPVVPAVTLALLSANLFALLVTFVDVNALALAVLVLVEWSSSCSCKSSSSGTGVVIWIGLETFRAPDWAIDNRSFRSGGRGSGGGGFCRLDLWLLCRWHWLRCCNHWFCRRWHWLAFIGNLVEDLSLFTHWLTLAVHQLVAFLAADMRAVGVVAGVALGTWRLLALVDILASASSLVKSVALVAIAGSWAFTKSFVDAFSMSTASGLGLLAEIVINALMRTGCVDAFLIFWTLVDVILALVDVCAWFASGGACVTGLAVTRESTGSVFANSVGTALFLFFTFIDVLAFAISILFVASGTNALVLLRFGCGW